MIRAVCFNRKSFATDKLKDICEKIKGKFGGCLTEPSMVNCIESYPDGSIYLSWTGQVPHNVYDCRNDINKFIQANSQFGHDK